MEEDHVQDYDGQWQQTYEEIFEPKLLHPAPPLVKLIEETPKPVEERLNEAASLIWQSAEASANQVRQAIECLMDDQKAVKTFISKSNKRLRLSLHDRIKKFSSKDPDNAELLLAIKWLGNSGSHPGGLTRENVFDSFDMIELVLINLYGKSAEVLRRKAKAINKAKGPAKGKNISSQ